LCKFLADGTRIACLEKVNSKINKIKIVDLKTGKIIKEVKIDADIWWYDLSFFPDGRKILYEKYHEIWVMDIDKNEKKLIFKKGNFALLSPDGNKIAFVKDIFKERAIWLMNADGSEAREIAKGWAGGDSRISWFPDSKRVCYSTKEHKIYVFDIEKNEIKEIAKGDKPAVSPDGSKIVYVKDILVKDLPIEVRDQTEPTIQPSVVYRSDMYIINLDDGSSPKKLTISHKDENILVRRFIRAPEWLGNKKIQFYYRLEYQPEKKVIITLE
jgi:Tol biopolymer transport system component